jgi:pyruvate dehydrogenase E2 component (dihydrolipoamide acetyltransferase)
MPSVPVNIPQIGEGLQEARLVGVLKQPGDHVKRDEPIYQMETDKAVMDVESPYEGVLEKWLAEVDEILPIGAAVAMMQVAGEESAATATPVAETATAESTADAARGGSIPPRTRAYAKEKGVSDEQLAKLAEGGAKVMPADIDALLGGGSKTGDGYVEKALAGKQRLLASRLVRGSTLVVPGTISVPVNWSPIERERARVKASGSEFQPSSFTMFAFAVTQALKEFPAFRSIMIGDDKIRTYDHVSLGIAVGLPGDELVIAAVPDADTLNWAAFAAKARDQIKLAREGKDQATEAVTVSLTNMQSFGLRDAIPVVVAPAVATVFLGSVYTGLDPDSDELKPIRCANVTITFDHRLINGVGAAEFLGAIKQHVETISSLLS